MLGKGSFGCAILCTRKKDNKQFVIKEIDISRMPPAEKESAHQEAKVGLAGKGTLQTHGTRACADGCASGRAGESAGHAQQGQCACALPNRPDGTDGTCDATVAHSRTHAHANAHTAHTHHATMHTWAPAARSFSWP